QATTRRARHRSPAPRHTGRPDTSSATAHPSPPWPRTPGYARPARQARAVSASDAAQHRNDHARTPPASEPSAVAPSQAPPPELAPVARTTGPRRRDSLSPIRQDALITGHGRKPVSDLARRPRQRGKLPGLHAGHGDADPSSATF